MAEEKVRLGVDPIYSLKGINPVQQFIFGLQQAVAMFGATVLVPLLTGLNVNTTLLMAGLGTLLFHVITGFKVPVFLGSSFAFIVGYNIVSGGDPTKLPYASGGIFELRGSVGVTLNTTLREQVFEIPQSFLDLLPDDAPTTVTVYAAAPEIDGSKREGVPPEFYISANIQGSIKLFDTITLTGFISFTAATDVNLNAYVRIAGAVSVNIEFL